MPQFLRHTVLMIGQRSFAKRIQWSTATIMSVGLGLAASTQSNLRAAPRTVSLSASCADGDNIQGALDALPTAGGEIFLGPGTYTVRHPIVLQRNFLTLRGSGSQTI